MLTAEIVAHKCDKKLAFEGWDAKGETFDWARDMRDWKNDWGMEGYGEQGMKNTVQTPAADVTPQMAQEKEGRHRSPKHQEPPDSDDESMSGYSSDNNSSRPPSPTTEEMEEFERDPTLRVGRSKPIPRPVYLQQLVALFRNEKDDKDAVERIEVALNNAEILVRRKKGFGFELSELLSLDHFYLYLNL